VSPYHHAVASRDGVMSTTRDLQSARLYGCFSNAAAADLLAYGCINCPHTRLAEN